MSARLIQSLLSILFLTGSPALLLSAHTATPGSTRPEDAYATAIVPFLDRYCFACHGHGKHKGDVRLDGWTNGVAAVGDRPTWERVLQKVHAREMPPEEKPQPSSRERDRFLACVEKNVFGCDCDHPDPGRVTVRRLNRAEYNNTIRDLLGVHFRPAEDFPVDDSGYGFDTIGDALSMPPVLIEKYLAAARKIVDQALGLGAASSVVTNHFSVDLLEVGYNAKQRGDGWVALNSIEEDDVAVRYEALGGGEFRVRVKAYARQDGSLPMQLTFMLGAAPVHLVEVETNAAAPRVYEAAFQVGPGRHRFRAVVRRRKEGLTEAEALKWKRGANQKGAVFVQQLEIIGPIPDALPGRATAATLVLPEVDSSPTEPAAREFLRRFATRAYRRPVTAVELGRLVDLAEAATRRCAATHTNTSGSHRNSGAGTASCAAEGLRVALQAVLVSPHFLFRGEQQSDPDNPKSVQALDDYALASRLSYFLWSSMPDEELLRLAGQGRLRRNLEGQVRRMLRDGKSEALVDHFAGQWLQLRNLDLATPDAEAFPTFDERLRASMRRETELFFAHIIRDDRSVLEFLTADYTFVDASLARHYGLPELPDASPDEFRRVSLRGTHRRGVLTQASVLLLTSNPTRTSPVKRGKWVLDNLLGTPPPPPPPNVPELKTGGELHGTLRERMEQHRADPLCASCHQRLDPIGFGLENFDGIGQWRTRDAGAPINATGKLAGGEPFHGPEELTRLLAESKRDAFVRCLAEKLLTYALGRGMEHYDKCALDQICRQTSRHGYRFSTLVWEVVKSVPFELRRGDAGAP